MNEINLIINGKPHRVASEPDRSLLHVLREEIGLTGTKYGCGEAQCGACTVLRDGVAVRSCVLPVGNVGDRPITTIEGLEKDGQLHPVQEAFLAEDAMQCGYCISGMILSGVSLLTKTPHPTDGEIVRAMTGNVCRCGSYPRIMSALKRAAEKGDAPKKPGGKAQ